MSHTIRHVYYKIYCVTDASNGMEYVGVTTKGLPWRLMHHSSSNGNGLLTRAMHTNRRNGFSIKTLATIIDDKQEALRTESEFIKGRGTLSPRGYNRTARGVKRPGTGESASKLGNTYATAHPVVQRTRDMVELHTYPSMKQAAEATGINRTGINAAANGKRPTAGGYIWTKTNTGN